MKKRLLILLLALLMIASLAATAEVSLPEGLTEIGAYAFEGDSALKGRVVLPDGVQTVAAGAFAGTRVHALVLPDGCTAVSGSVLAGTEAAYLYLKGGSTRIVGTLDDVAYVFGPAFGITSTLENFYATDTLMTDNGFYYSVTEGTAIPLCAVDGTAISGEITIPKLVDGQPVRSLDTLIVHGCDNLDGLLVPAYLAAPGHLSVTTYQTMTASAPVPSSESANVGDTLTWTTSLNGAYGSTSFLWSLDTNGVIETVTTTEPALEYTLKTAGELVVTVTATDEVGDTASAASEIIEVDQPDPVYRALLIGNTYTGTTNELAGPENDITGMRYMLKQMTRTPYRISTHHELSADEMTSAILDAFDGATVNDVSLFYFSGHGANAIGSTFHGALQGTGGSYLSIAKLKATLDQIPGKKVVIVDTCHSGALIGKSGDAAAVVSTSELHAFNSSVVNTFAVTTQTKGENDLANSSYYVITAAHSTEECITMGRDADGDGVLDKHFGLFTYSLCHGSGWNLATNAVVNMNADSDDNGELTLHEAYAYARWMAQQSNPNQTAQIYPANSNLVVWGK